MTVFALSPLAIAGIVVVAAAFVVLLVSLLHPEGLRRPGGYLDGKLPQPDDVPPDDDRSA